MVMYDIRKFVNSSLVKLVTYESTGKYDVVLLIHPLNHLKVDSDKKNYGQDYNDNVFDLFENDSRVVIVLERNGLLDETFKSFVGYKPKGHRYFVETSSQSSFPLMGWKNLSDFVKSFSPDNVCVCGCFLTSDKTSACVGEAFKNLKVFFPRVSFIEDCSLSPP